MEYEYKNLKSNKIIKFNIDEKFAFIYGPNGTGKTTFSRAIGNGKRIKDKNINKIHLVFNQDFINNNIYISTSDGTYKSDVKNRSKLKQIFLGDSSKEDNETLNFLRQKIREYGKLTFNINNFKSDFKNIVMKLIEDDERYLKEYEKYILEYVDDELLYRYFKNVLERIDKENLKINSLKIDDEEYISKIDLGNISTTYSEEQIKDELFKFYKECYDNEEKSLNSIVDNFNKNFLNTFKVDDFNKKYEIISNLIENMKLSKELYEIVLKLDSDENKYLEEILNGKNVNISNVKKWIAEGDNFHKKIDFESCLYCRNEISEEIKENKIKLLKNKYITYFSEYKKM